MKKFLFLLLAVTAGTAPAQTLVYPGEHEMPPVPKTFDNELGVRYGAQLYVGDGRGPELQAFSIDYARYNFYNIGFRTGLNVFVDEDAENYFSVPLQFTWRTGRIASSWRRESRERSVQNNYYNGSYADPYGAYSGGRGGRGQYVSQRAACDPALGVRGPCGLYPGADVRPFTTEGYSTTDPSWRPYTVRQRFSCTFDAGARLIIPIWRFNLFGDFTYHCYLTDNFRAGEFRPSRSYMGLGVGLSFNF